MGRPASISRSFALVPGRTHFLMNNATFIPFMAGDAGVRISVLLVLRQKASTYGHRVGKFFRDDSVGGLFVYERRRFSLEEWHAEGPDLLLRYSHQRPYALVQTEVIKDVPAAESPVDVPQAPDPDVVAASEDVEVSTESAAPEVATPPPPSARRARKSTVPES